MSASSAIAGAIAIIPSTDGSGPTLSGGGITANTIVKTQTVTVGSNTSSSTATASGLKITNVYVTDSSYNILDDTALPASGGYLKIAGTGFKTGCAAYINGSSLTTTFVSSTEINIVVPSQSVGVYSLMIFNTDGNGAIYLNLGVSNFPSFTTTAGSLGAVYETNGFSQSVSATGDTPFSYSLYSGSLPPGATLNSDGTITGTSQVESGSSTYSFVVNVKDAQNQDSQRSFSLTINTDVVTWSSPANNTSYILVANTAISNVSLAATSAAGYSISYAANTLPTGVSLSGNTIFGTPTTSSTVYTELTATAATTTRSAKRYISWTVQIGDAQFYNTTLLLNGDTGSNVANTAQNNTFLDSSVNNFTITRAGNATQGSFTPFSQTGWSNYFDGTTGYLTNTSSPGVANFGTGDFTWEAWLFFTSTDTTSEWEIFEAQPTSGAFQVYRSAANALSFGLFGVSGTNVTPTNAIPLSQWFHLAISRTSGTSSCYINGVRQTTLSDTRNFTQTGISIGARNTGVNFMPGFISNMRIIKGTGIYSGTTITVPTTALTAITNTTLLTCQSNRFIDNSTNAFALTVNGSPAVQAYSPFSPGVAYTPATHGGSGYFDGTGDYVAFPAGPNTAFALGAGDWTVEMWMYPTSVAATGIVFDIYDANSAGRFLVQLNTNKTIGFYGSSAAIRTVSTNTVTPNQWNHVVLCKSGSSTRIFINGVQANTTYNDTNTYTCTTGVIYLAANGANGINNYTGYISDFRVIKGSALYTTTFTPPAAPLTAVSNTSALLNFTNAGIVDAHSSNVIETVGNAQLSTAVTKFGTASLAFDGTGDYLKFLPGPNQNFAMGAGDWTIEMWIYPTSSAAVQLIFDIYDGASAGRLTLQLNTARTIGIYGATGTVRTATTSTVTLNTWNHIAFCKASGSTRIFINGTQGNTTYADSVTYTCTTGAVYMASNGSTPGNYFFGYIDDFRITKGYARYTTNFTAPTVPLLAQ